MKTTKKKSFKRLFAFLMAFVMVTALAANAVFAAGSFTDVSEGDDFYENIESLYEQGIIGGFADGTFRPGDYLTRQQAAKMIALGANYGDHDGTGSKLVDVADLTWGQENIWALEAAGVVKGFGTSKEFRPRLNITRGHVAKMIALAFGLEEGDVEVDLIDLPSDEEVADAIRILASNGIVSGFGKSKEFRPDALVTRGQFAKMVDLAMEAVQLKVVSVRAINGVTIEVRFNKPVNKTSAERTGNLSKVDIAGVSIKGRTLSEDGKVLTLNVRMQGYGNRALDVTNAAVEVKPVRSKDDSSVRSLRYVGLLTYKDTVAPTASVERVNYNTWTLKFSEPVKDGTVAGDAGLSFTPSTIDNSYFDGEIIVTIADPAKVGEELEITINGVRDIAGNLIEPQPTKLKVSLAAKDEVTPEIVSIVQTGAKTFEIEFDKPATLNSITVDTYTLATNGIVAVEDSETAFVVTVTAKLNGIRVITVPANGVANADGVKNEEALTKTVTFTEDTVAPKASAQYVEIDGEKYIQLTFDKKVTAGTVAYSGSYIKDYVTTSVSAGTETATLADDTDNVLLLKLGTTPLNVEGAAYTLALSNSGDSIKSDADVVWAETLNITFIRGEDVAPELPNEAVAEVANIKNGATPDKVEVTFNVGATGKLDGASATNIANYSIAGATVESATLAAASSSQQVVTLTLVKNSNTFTGVRVITISNVKIHESTKVMDPFTTSIYSLKENVRPTVVKAELGGLDGGVYKTITVTFSEKITGTTGYEVYVGDEDTARGATAATSSTSLVITVTDGLGVADIAAGIEVEFAGTGIADDAGNLLEATTVPVGTP